MERNEETEYENRSNRDTESSTIDFSRLYSFLSPVERYAMRVAEGMKAQASSLR